MLNKSDRTIAYEIKKHIQKSTRNKFNNYYLFPCEKLKHTPFICNGCEDKAHCRKNKYFYYGKDANDSYKELLVTSRTGIDMETAEFNDLNTFVKDEYFTEHYEEANIVQMDTVVGPNIENQSCILTLLFENSRFLMIFKLANKTMSEVDKAFDYLRSTLGLDLFSYLFQIILTDNGSEFFDANHIENNETFPKTHLFFCDPMQSQQKGRIEVVHEYIRRYIPKGSSFNYISQNDLTFISNNINSIPRDKLSGMNAFKIQKFFTPDDFFTKLNFKEINSKDIIIKKYN